MDTDSLMDDIPVRDPGGGGRAASGLEAGHGQPHQDSASRIAQQRRAVAKISREELEDKYLRMHDENLILKKHARKQEEKIKKMATKLLRLVNDRKKQDQEGGRVRKVRDVETEEMLEDTQAKVRELEKVNDMIKNKLMVAKQQLATQSQRPSQYPHVQSRINTGLAKPAPPDHIKKGLRVQGGSRSGTPRALRTDVLPRYGHSLLEEARGENQRLEEIIQDLQDQIAIQEQDKEILREQMRTRQYEHQEAQMILKEQMSVGQRTTAKSNIQENVEMIRLQRETKEKSTKLIALKTKYANLEENLTAVKVSHDAVLAEMESLNKQLQREQSKTLELQTQLKSTSSSARTILELQDRIADIEREKEILNEANEKLLNSAFDAERERQYRANEKQLKLQIAQLEATLKGDLNDKNTLLDKLNEEREQYEKLQKENQEVQIKYFGVRQQFEELQEKMRFFTKESAVDFQELEEALIIVKKKKERGTHELEFLEKVDDEMNKDLQHQIGSLQADHAETASELEKTRNMLILQHKINRDYQLEVENATQRLEEYKQEYELKLDESAQLLDMRAARIKKLERQLRDIAYGTKQYKVTDAMADEQEEVYEEVDESIHLERGENLLEIHVEKISYTKEGLKILGDDDPSTFVTYEFFEFELQSTPVVKGAKPVFDFTSQYKVCVDDFFLQHLMKGSTTLEMHQAVGTDYHTMAACQLRFRDLLDNPHGRVQGTAQLVGLTSGHTGANVGTVDFWVRLRVPMERALRLFRERVKAMGYMSSNQKATKDAISTLNQADQSVKGDRDENINDITIKLVRCNDLKARREGVQPNPYAVYRFFDNNDHDTTIVTSSNSPEFNDSRTYPVHMNADLDKYIRTGTLEVYIFDDADPEDTAYIGVAKVPLITLAHDKPIKGTFELKQSDGKTTGTIDVLLQWRYTYMAPKMTSGKPTSRPNSAKKTTVSIAQRSQGLASTPVSASPIRPTPRVRGGLTAGSPLAASTPAVARSEAKRDRVAEGEGHESMVAVQPKPPAEPRKAAIQFQPTIAVTPPPQDEEPSLDSNDISEETPPIDEKQPDSTPFDTEEEDELEPVNQAMAGTTTIEPSEDDEERMLEEELMREEGKNKEETRDVEEEDEEEDLVAMEMSHQYGDETQIGKTGKYEDTMFGDPPEEEEEEDDDSSIGAEVDIPVASEEGQESGNDEIKSDDEMSADSDAIVMTPSVNRPGSTMASMNDDVVIVTISHLSLEPDTPLMDSDLIQRFYVEYRFLGIAPEELETPFSLPKPKPFQNLVYNFRKVFHVDAENNKLRRDYLASMLLPQDPSEGKIRFTLVSEPPEDQQDLECEDVGYAFVDMREVLNEGKDVIEQDLDIYNVKDDNQIVGTMNVTVECIDALRAVEQELEQYEDE